MSIHPTALIDPDARLAPDVVMGPYCVVEADVEVAEGTTVGAHAVLKSGLRLGRRVTVHEGAVLGGLPQDKKFSGAPSFAVVGDDTVIREYTTLHRSATEGGTTRVGRGCYIMGFGHVAHDCDIGDEAVIASYAALAGHIHVGARAFISGGAVIHQFSHVGEISMIGGGSKVNLDVPPFLTVDGVPARAVGLNVVGLRRSGASDDDVAALKKAYRTLFRQKLPLAKALESLESADNAKVRRLAEFVRASERGVCRDRSRR